MVVGVGETEFKPIMSDLQKLGTRTLQVPIRDAATAQQVNTLLGVFGMTMSALNGMAQIDEDAPGREHILAGEPRHAVETTFIKVCAALDGILEDKARWSMEQQDLIELQRQELHLANLKFAAAQTHASEEITTPHFRYRPALARSTSGEWLAYLGNVDDLDNAILGVGPTPQHALLAFDAEFTGAPVSKELAEWLIKREQDLEAGNNTDLYPKITHEAINEVDGIPNAEIIDPSPSGEDESGNCDGPGCPVS